MIEMLPVSRGGVVRHPERVHSFEMGIELMYRDCGAEFFDALRDEAKALAARGELWKLADRITERARAQTRADGAAHRTAESGRSASRTHGP